MHVSFRKSAALQWDQQENRFNEVSLDQLSWSITDVGTMFGAILVERLRTYDGKLIDIADHMDRICSSACLLKIDIGKLKDHFESVLRSLVEKNIDLILRLGDVSLVLLLSPGESDSAEGFGKHPTCMAHLSPLPFAKLHRWYSHGAKLVLSKNTIVPDSCWPTQIKCRSRLPYLFADIENQNETSETIAVLETTRGTIADSSVANLVISTHANVLVTPPASDALIGCTLKSLIRLANKNDLQIQFRELTRQDLYEANELILTGTNGGVWFASSFDGITIGNGCSGPMHRTLAELWSKHAGMNYIQQAAERSPEALADRN